MKSREDRLIEKLNELLSLSSESLPPRIVALMAIVKEYTRIQNPYAVSKAELTTAGVKNLRKETIQFLRLIDKRGGIFVASISEEVLMKWLATPGSGIIYGNDKTLPERAVAALCRGFWSMQPLPVSVRVEKTLDFLRDLQQLEPIFPHRILVSLLA